ncbi:hypothetical protein [Geminocystis sp. NIES-3709]|uniref:hypothetical protein n=1 Tax=Geminocystis sp. NIES-3709 TaxID=1617448 RepID=UPI0005FCC773|nr:hypothetical protein [Geminocystis sp. NIES-3709]BAQ63820.1 hypothetical protein GM3709_585 [Geminocystis sp. NIES-3709]
MISLIKIGVTISALMTSLFGGFAPAFSQNLPPSRENIQSSSFLIASIIDDAYAACSSQLAEYGVTVTGIVDSFSGKGGATLILSGYNSGGTSITARCTLTIPSYQVDIEYL